MPQKTSRAKSFNQSNIEQLGVYTVRLSYKDKTARCRLFVEP